MHTIKITPNLLFEYQCTTANLSDCRIESNRNFFYPNWNARIMDVSFPCTFVPGNETTTVNVHSRNETAYSNFRALERLSEPNEEKE